MEEPALAFVHEAGKLAGTETVTGFVTVVDSVSVEEAHAVDVQVVEVIVVVVAAAATAAAVAVVVAVVTTLCVEISVAFAA